ncbi:MAG: hypothetical protein OXC91_00565 [Rhodobacteraceae bacterium]|nr:hypothetical protein [Paracoccaceae bacterium]
MIRTINDYVQKGNSSAFETTLSGRAYASSIPCWQACGYHVTLYFLRLPTPDMAVFRVQQRVVDGGHDIPDDVVHRRFQSGWSNFLRIYRKIVDK